MRPVTETFTALCTFSMAPRGRVGTGRIGSIQPWAKTAGASDRKRAQATPSTLFGDSMATCSVVRDARETFGGGGLAQTRRTGGQKTPFLSAGPAVRLSAVSMSPHTDSAR